MHSVHGLRISQLAPTAGLKLNCIMTLSNDISCPRVLKVGRISRVLTLLPACVLFVSVLLSRKLIK